MDTLLGRSESPARGFEIVYGEANGFLRTSQNEIEF